MERNIIIALKVNDKERDIFQSNANLRGLTRSSYLRTCALQDAYKQKMKNEHNEKGAENESTNW